ncbi:hypothetical protein AZA_53494 [Nitrospirillum viridazoti Y2]|nr:hypothetical protein AZA_53494 [Nitrospirillum amazonense Y2]
MDAGGGEAGSAIRPSSLHSSRAGTAMSRARAARPAASTVSPSKTRHRSSGITSGWPGTRRTVTGTPAGMRRSRWCMTRGPKRPTRSTTP